jgi:hypothetical protein
MALSVVAGRFYEFHRERVISRPGQPLSTRDGVEVGPEIPREVALRRVKAGRDVYTAQRRDAYELATDAHGRLPGVEEIHKPKIPSPTGRLDVYFQHFHPGGIHHGSGGGGVYFGGRGEGLDD